MYSVYDTAQKADDYLSAFVDAQLPIVIGEFGGPADQYGDPDEAAVMAAARRLDLGWLAWSWSGNTDPSLDQRGRRQQQLAVGLHPERIRLSACAKG